MAIVSLVVMAVLTRGCHETSESEAVGLAHCRSFGGWNDDPGFKFGFELPRFGFGWTELIVDRNATSVCTPVGKTCPTVAHFPAGALGGLRLSAATLELEMPVVRWGPLWLGPMVGLATTPGWSKTRGTPLGQTRLDSPLLNTYGATFVAQLRLGRVTLDGGLLVAGSDLSLDATTASPQRLVDAWFSLQARAGVGVWVTPGFALNLTGRVDLLRTDHWTMALSMVVPTGYPFAGLDSVW